MVNVASVLRMVSVCALTVAASAAVAGVDELPEDIRNNLYNPDLIDPNQPVGDSAYRDWVAPNAPPWTIGYASSYAGNTWRAAVMEIAAIATSASPLSSSAKSSGTVSTSR